MIFLISIAISLRYGGDIPGIAGDIVFQAQASSLGVKVHWQPNLPRLPEPPHTLSELPDMCSDMCFELYDMFFAVCEQGPPRITQVTFPLYGRWHEQKLRLLWPSKLRSLYMPFYRMDEDALTHLLSRLPPSLLFLTLRGTGLNDGHLQIIANRPELQNLERLDVGYGRVTSTGIRSLSAMHNLVDLSCPITNVDDDCLATLGKLKRLRNVDLSGTRVTAAGLVKHRSFLGKLRSLDLSGISSLGDDEVRQLASAAPRLVEFRLSNTQVTNASLPVLLSMKKIKRITLYQTDVRFVSLRGLDDIPPFGPIEIVTDSRSAGDLMPKGNDDWFPIKNVRVPTKKGNIDLEVDDIFGGSDLYSRKNLDLIRNPRSK